ncbi:MAG TPA: hypothetical protein VK463_15400 [Desulfomonilaceae bacterium]|nr:hypothetical protein [Desulfomonilaceae bacterium]
MQIIKVVFVVGVMSLALVAFFPGSSNAQQTPGPVSGQLMQDTVVNPGAAGITVPVTTVRWRGWYGPRWRGWYGRPYYRAYWGPYAYGGYCYSRPRCWWNGYRWKCGSRRAFVY